jgi:hypothetical protein
LREQQLELQARQLSIEQAKLTIEFAKFGFVGTLFGATAGMVLILGLALLSGLTNFKLETWGIVVMTLAILIGSIAFGYFSLREIPRIATRIQKEVLEINISPKTIEGGVTSKEGATPPAAR